MSLLEIPPILPSAKPSYRLAFSDQEPSIKNPADPLWRKAESLEVASFHPRTGTHRPKTTVRLLYNTSGIFIRFDVQDRWVRSVHTRYQDPVSQDSCVEWFVEPHAGAGYYNIEANCGGTLLIGYHPPSALPTRVPEKMATEILLHTSLPLTTEPEIPTPLDWTLAYFVPFKALKCLRLVGGAGYLIQGQGNIMMTPTGNYTFSNYNLTGAEVGTLDMKVNWEGVAPYLGIGVFKSFPSTFFNFNLDLGTYYLTQPKTKIVGTNLLVDNNQLEPQFNDNLKDYRWLPVLQLNFNFRIK
jgi:hypothetical protein